MNPRIVFGGLYLLLTGGFLTVAQSAAQAIGVGGNGFAWTGGPLVTYAVLIAGVLVAIAGTWARGGEMSKLGAAFALFAAMAFSNLAIGNLFSAAFTPLS